MATKKDKSEDKTSKAKQPEGDEPQVNETEKRELTDAILDDTANRIFRKEGSLDSTVPQMAAFFKADSGELRKKLEERIEKLTATAEQDKPRLKENEVFAHVPHNFNLRTPAGLHQYKAGSVVMPKEHAEHWYSKANGVKIVA